LVFVGLLLSSCGSARDCDCPSFSQQIESQSAKG
jgi:hypothetical protein